jgi:hypothetical protein
MLMATAVVGAGPPSLLVDEGELLELVVVEVPLLPIIALSMLVVEGSATVVKSPLESSGEVME